MTGCDQGHLVSAYLDGELSPKDAARFEAHLANCPQCQETISEIRHVDEALRQQSFMRRSLLSNCSESIADSVQRELTRSGEFSRARRVSWLRRYGRRLLNAAAVVLVAVAAVITVNHLLAGRQSPVGDNGGDGNQVAPVRQLELPEMADVFAEAHTLLSSLQREAGEPGAVLRLREKAASSMLLERLLVAQSRCLERPDGAVSSLRIALTDLVNLPDENIDRHGRRLAAALLESRLLMRLAELQRLPASSAGGSAASPLNGLRSDDALTAQLNGDHEQAIELFDRRRQSTRDKIIRSAASFGIAQSLFAWGRHEEASEAFLAFVEENPDHRLADDALMAAADANRLTADGRRASELYGQLRLKFSASRYVAVALLHQGRLAEEEGDFPVALRLYGLVGNAQVRHLRDEAEARRRFIVENRDADFIALQNYRRAEVQSRDEESWTDAFLTLVRLANSYRKQPIGDDALVLLMRMHLARGDMEGAEQRFRRLMELGPRTLARSDAREIALEAAGWLLMDAAGAVAGGNRIFAELSEFKVEAALQSPQQTGRSWQLSYALPAGGGGSEAGLKFLISYSRAEPGERAHFENLRLRREVEIETPNMVLREELERIVKRVDDALSALDSAAATRHVAAWNGDR